MTQILVTGGTGTLGKLVVKRLLAAGQKVRVLTRQTGRSEAGVEFVTGDLATGDGAEAAALGAEIIIHCAGGSKGDDDKARHIARAAANAKAKHLLYISVVGADRIPIVSGMDRMMFGYFETKLIGERFIAESGVPWTTLRATQFHTLCLGVAQAMAKMPIAPFPGGLQVQPIDADEVAARLVELSLGSPAGLVPDMGGPKIYQATDMLRDTLRAMGKGRPVLSMKQPGQAARAFRNGANLTPDHAVGQRTWEDFLAERLR